MKNKLKAMLKEGKVAFGTGVGIGHPDGQRQPVRRHRPVLGHAP